MTDKAKFTEEYLKYLGVSSTKNSVVRQKTCVNMLPFAAFILTKLVNVSIVYFLYYQFFFNSVFLAFFFSRILFFFHLFWNSLLLSLFSAVFFFSFSFASNKTAKSTRRACSRHLPQRYKPRIPLTQSDETKDHTKAFSRVAWFSFSSAFRFHPPILPNTCLLISGEQLHHQRRHFKEDFLIPPLFHHGEPVSRSYQNTRFAKTPTNTQHYDDKRHLLVLG